MRLRTAALIVVSVAAGVLSGLWLSSLDNPCPAFCLFATLRFAAWESSVFGGAVASLGLIIANFSDAELVPRCAHGLRSAWHYLFEDLSHHQVS
jgi:hypothetical protein